MKLKISACIDAPKEKVWAALSDVSNVHLWVEQIESAHCEGVLKKGVDTVRVCKLNANMTVIEKWIQWDEGNSFTYKADETKFFNWAKNKWSVVAVNGKTLITTESEVDFKGGILKILFEPVMYLISKKMANDSLAALQYLLENDHPFEGRFSKLPRIPNLC